MAVTRAMRERFPHVRLRCCKAPYCCAARTASYHRGATCAATTTAVGTDAASPADKALQGEGEGGRGKVDPTTAPAPASAPAPVETLESLVGKITGRGREAVRGQSMAGVCQRFPRREKNQRFPCAVCMDQRPLRVLSWCCPNFSLEDTEAAHMPPISPVSPVPAVPPSHRRVCTALVCRPCMLQYVSTVVDSAGCAAVPPVRCFHCKTRIPTHRWTSGLKLIRLGDSANRDHNDLLAATFAKYKRNEVNVRSIRCRGCDATGPILRTSSEEEAAARTGLGETLQAIGGQGEGAMAAARTVWSFVQGEITGDAFILSIENAIIQSASSERAEIIRKLVREQGVHSAGLFKRLLFSFDDIERRAVAVSALMRHLPRMRTRCCREPFCYTCKISSHHRGTSCAENLAKEKSIEAQYCPSCSVPTVRSEGCTNIVCLCGRTWEWRGLGI